MDALQDIFVKLINYSGKSRDAELVIPWIMRITKNHCLNIIRFRKKFVANEVLEYLPAKGSFEDSVGNRLLIEQILSLANPKIQDAVYYTYIEQLDQQEIYKVTGQSPATIRRNLARFKSALPSIQKKLGIAS